MWIWVRGGGSDNVYTNFGYVLAFLGSFGLFNACLVVFGLFHPKEKKKIKIQIVNVYIFLNIIKIRNVDKDFCMF